MTSPIFNICKMLDDAHIHYDLKRNRPDTIMLMVYLVGERVEVDVFEDGHIEISRFRGDESVEDAGIELLQELIRRETEDC